MIFLTVGTQLPFDRLVRAVDEWAGECNQSDIVAQIGPTDFVPRHMRYQSFVSPTEFTHLLTASDLIISHAGMGTILSALGLGKPVLVMPRQAKLQEHRNDHQLATARRFKELGRIKVAMDEQEMRLHLNESGRLSAGARIAPYATDELLACVRKFIEAV